MAKPGAKLKVEAIIAHYKLQALPVEGGMFVQTYKAQESIPREHLPPRYRTDKPFGTAILYLLTADPNSFSALHKLPSDEIYHFYLGDLVEMLLLFPDGTGRQMVLGQDILEGQNVQFCVPQGIWQGSRLAAGGSWAWMGTSMAPGYTEDDYQGGVRAALIAQYPKWSGLIRDLTRP